MHTQFYDKVAEHNTLYYTNNSYTHEEFKETVHDLYNKLFGFETATS